MADKDARSEATAPAPPPPADALDGTAGGLAEWIKRARACNREREARASGEAPNDAAHTADGSLQARSRLLPGSGMIGTGA
jgi:hypothetical protein